MIIGDDPGKMTGLFIFGGYDLNRIELPALEAADEVFRCLNVHTGPHHIHAERFIMQSKKQTQQPDALEHIGQLKWIANYFGASFKLHSRSERARVTREQLMNIGWWSPGKDHVNQAARCALLGLVIHDSNHDLVRRAFGTI